MSKLYNTQKDITSNFEIFLLNSVPNIRKTQLNIIPSILFGIIQAESIASSDIAKNLKDNFLDVKLDSVIKRINRFFRNKLFDPYTFYKQIISYAISTYKKKHSDKRVHIIFDHMFSHENYTTLMFTMRLGSQGIPIWFKCFKGVSDNDAFMSDTILQGIKEVSDMFSNSDFNLIFLADRWFNSCDILNYIDSLGHTYCIWLKKPLYVYYFDDKEGHIIRKTAGDLFHYKHRSTIYSDIFITKQKLKCNVVISDSKDTDDPWIIATNGDHTRAIKDYSYRFGAIECVFKNQKSNGFYLEKITTASLKAFTSMFCLVCVCVLFLTLLGAYYSRNRSSYKKENITTHKNYIINGKKIKKRVLSLFNTGLTLFKRAFNSHHYVSISYKFILYDI